MSLFILPENQKIIWDTINKAPQFSDFGKYTNESKEDWFREIIQQIYNKHKDKSMNVQELRQLNKETISTMIHSLKSKTTTYTNINSIDTDTFNTSYINENKTATRNYMLEQKQEVLNKEFVNRQQEFESLMSRKQVKEIDFREQTDTDQPIENMDELLKKHIRDREYEIESTQSKPPFVNEGSVSKSVKWASDIDNTKSSYIDTNIFQDFVKRTNNEIQQLRNEINDIKMRRPTEGTTSAQSLLSRMRRTSNVPMNELEDISKSITY